MKTTKRLTPIRKAKKVKTIKAKEEPWKQDRRGFFLIKINHKDKIIHVGYCTNDNVLKYDIVGKKAEEIYHTIAKLKLISLFGHASYLGKELEKAELAIKYKLKYVQDKNLDFKDKKSK